HSRFSRDWSSDVCSSDLAIIGASNTPSRIGGRPIHAMQVGGFRGDIYPVNPNHEVIQGLPAYASIHEVPQGIDCAIIAVAAKLRSEERRVGKDGRTDVLS